MRRNILENEVPDTPNPEKYVAGTLGDEENARFEEAMIARPDLAADVAVRQRIKAGLALLEERSELAGFVEAPPPRSSMRYAAAAATLVFLVGGTWMLLRSQGPSFTTALLDAGQVEGAAISTTAMLTLTRSGAPPPEISASRTGLIHFQILTDDPPAQARVALEERGPDGFQAISAPLATKVDAQGSIDVYLDPARLQSGAYALQVTSGDGGARRLPFALRLSE